MNRFKGLDLDNSVPEELWTEVHNIVQEVVNKTISKKRRVRRQSGYLLNSRRTKRSEKQGREEKVPPLKHRVSKNSWKRQEDLL